MGEANVPLNLSNHANKIRHASIAIMPFLSDIFSLIYTAVLPRSAYWL